MTRRTSTTIERRERTARPARSSVSGLPVAGERPALIPDPTVSSRLHESLGRDLVYRYRLGANAGYEYVSPSCLAMTGYSPAEFYADPTLAVRIVHRDDLHIIAAMHRGTVRHTPYVVRWIRRDGTVVWTEHHTTIARDEAGIPTAIEGIARDVTETHLAREAVGAAEHGLRAFMDAAPHFGVIVDPLGRIAFANAAFLAATGWTSGELVGRDWAGAFLRDPAVASEGREFLGLAGGWATRREVISPVVLTDERQHAVRWTTMGLYDVHGHLSGVAALGDDLTREREHGIIAGQLAAAVEHTTDAVIITDAASQIVFVNPAFERTSGFTRDEVLGKNPRVLQSGHHNESFYRMMWWTLSRGRTWVGELVNRRKDGALLVEETSISPVKDASGEVIAYVSVAHNVTKLRALRASLDDEHRRREMLAAALDRLVIRSTVGETCEDIATVLRELPGSIAAAVALADDDGAMRVAAVSATTPVSLKYGSVIPHALLGQLPENPILGHWITPIARPSDETVAGQVEEMGIVSMLMVPLRHDGQLLGVLVVGGSDEFGADLAKLVPDVTEVASVARSLIAPKIVSRIVRGQLRERIRKVIESEAFHTVFQPIVNLETGKPIGFEALSRFDGGNGPSSMFADADLAGVGPELEKATIARALQAAKALPRGAFLALNVTADTACDAEALPEVLATETRRIVLELSERNEVPSYPRLRAMLAALGPNVEIAIDRVGAGITNFVHLVELHPEFVKLDQALIRGIEKDPTRQALIMGLKQFAKVSGRALIAEGIETEAERATLIGLEVRYGQGFLLGMPARAEAWMHTEVDQAA